MEEVRWSDVRLPLVPGAAIVTGGASGIGRAVAEALTAQGARVACVDRVAPAVAGLNVGPREPGEASCPTPPSGPAASHPPYALYLERDVRDFAAAEDAVREVEAKLGPASILVACAGIRRDRASWNLSEEDWRTVLDVDLTGSFTYARALAPRMRERGQGRIVFVSSINGLRGKFGQANYAAAKAGLVGLAKTLARELGPRGITVNVVAPGMVRTPLTANLTPEQLEQSRRETVLGRLGEPEDVAATILFLCSSLARHVTGEVVRVDGGQAI
jgi:acetoacetyl-CoA reductase/3-oxoacyl-[acyl-carrier protein] reductase